MPICIFGWERNHVTLWQSSHMYVSGVHIHKTPGIPTFSWHVRLALKPLLLLSFVFFFGGPSFWTCSYTGCWCIYLRRPAWNQSSWKPDCGCIIVAINNITARLSTQISSENNTLTNLRNSRSLVIIAILITSQSVWKQWWVFFVAVLNNVIIRISGVIKNKLILMHMHGSWYVQRNVKSTKISWHWWPNQVHMQLSKRLVASL